MTERGKGKKYGNVGKGRVRRVSLTARTAIFMAAVFCISLSAGCSLFSKKPTGPTTPTTPATRNPKPGAPGQTSKPGNAPSLTLTGGKEFTGTDDKDKNAAQKKPDLIKESGFDMIYPNFNKETGRTDPFVPVSLSSAPLDVVKRMTPEKFRVIGTAMTPSGQIAMIEVGDQTKIVREGDVLESGHVVKTISRYDVSLDKDGRVVQLTMFTRKRIAQSAEEINPKLPGMNINDMYNEYLKAKYGEDVEGQEGESDRPRSFSEYLTQEKDTAKKILEEEKQ